MRIDKFVSICIPKSITQLNGLLLTQPRPKNADEKASHYKIIINQPYTQWLFCHDKYHLNFPTTFNIKTKHANDPILQGTRSSRGVSNKHPHRHRPTFATEYIIQNHYLGRICGANFPVFDLLSSFTTLTYHLTLYRLPLHKTQCELL